MHARECVCGAVGEYTGHEFTGDVRSNEDGTHSFKCVCGEYGGRENCVDEGGDGKCDKCGARMSVPITPIKPAMSILGAIVKTAVKVIRNIFRLF